MLRYSLLILSLLVLSCSGTHEIATQLTPGSLDEVPFRIQTRWQVPLSETSALAYKPQEHSQPAYSASGRTVVAGSSAGILVAADARTGRLRWTHDVPDGIADGVTISGSAVYAAGRNGTVHKLDLASGTSLWSQAYKTTGSITSAPAVANNRVVIQTNENRTYVIDAKTGEYVWDKGRMRGAGLTIQGEGGAVIDGAVVFAGYDDGVLAALSLEDGSSLWTRELSGDKTQFVDVDTRPIVRGNSVYAGSYSNGYFSVGRKHGNIRWHHPVDGVSAAALGDGRLYLALRDRRVRALDPSTGAVLWQTHVGRHAVSRPVLATSGLWVSTGDGLVWLDPAKGFIRGRLSPDDGQTAPIAGTGGWIHMVTNSGSLVGAQLL